MILGRTSFFSKPLFPIITVIMLAGFFPGVRAACWFDENTRDEQCNTLSAAARAAIALTIFLVFLILFLGTIAYRRRRQAQANQAFIHQVQGGQGLYGYNGGLSPLPPQYPPQYPPQSYNGSPYTHYSTTGNIAPVALPSQYAPPPGAPPISSNYYNKGGVMA